MDRQRSQLHHPAAPDRAKHARLYYAEGKWFLQDVTETLQVRHNGYIARWFPLEFDSQTFVLGPWLCCFFTGLASEVSQYDKTIKASAETDALTRLPLRMPFERRLVYELKHCGKSQQPLSVLHLDLDHFHNINEKYEHAGGDAVLVEVADRMRSLTRGREMVSRYGGEEFTVLLPYASEAHALEVAERLRRAFAEMPVMHNGNAIRITASIGCATTYQTMDGKILIGQADRAMFRAKQMGRNCVCLYDASVDGMVFDDDIQLRESIRPPSSSQAELPELPSSETP